MSNIGNGKKLVLVTGSSGHLGSELVRHLGSRYEIIGLDRPGAPPPPSPAHDIRIDLGSDDSVRTSLGRIREQFKTAISSVIHLAAFASFEVEQDPRFEKINVDGTRRLIDALQDFDVGQFVYSSTMLVHAPTTPGKPIDVDSPLQPAWGYPESKIQAEQVIRERRGAIPSVILRMAGVYNEDCGLPALAQQIARIYERQLKAHIFPGDSTHGQSAVHLDDLLDVFSRVIAQQGNLPEESMFMVGEPVAPSYADLQHEIGRLIHGKPWDFQEIPKALAKTGAWMQEAALPEEKEPFVKHWMIDIADAHYELDISRARDELGWQPQHRLMDTLPEMINRLKREPRGWYELNHLEYPGHEEERSQQGGSERRNDQNVRNERHQ